MRWTNVLAKHGTASWGHAPTEGQGHFREVLARRFGGEAEQHSRDLGRCNRWDSTCWRGASSIAVMR